MINFQSPLSMLIVVFLLSASVTTGCDAKVFNQTLHQKIGWRAEDFYDDPQLIELCRAIEADDLEKIQQLINAGVDVNAKGKDNMTPLMWAFPDEKLPRFELLLKAGADPNVYIKTDLGVPNGFAKGDSVTHMACRTYFPYFNAVFENGGDPNLIDGRRIERGQTPIYSVVEGAVPDAKERIKVLIDKGADINHRLEDFSGGGNIITFAATYYGQYDLCNFLIDEGADPDIYKSGFLMKLTHLLARRNLSPDFASSKQIADYKKLVAKIESMGESMDRARAEMKEWDDQFETKSSKKAKKERQRAENKAAWLKRQEAKKAKADE